MKFNTWFETFIDEKNFKFQEYKIEHNDIIHYLDSDIVIENILNAPSIEQKKIKDTLVKIDFKNGDIGHFFHHLAGALVKMNY